jgi:integrase
VAGSLTELAAIDRPGRRLRRGTDARRARCASRREAAGPPNGLATAITWIERNTVPLADLADPDILRRVLNQLARKQDGTPAAATVVARKRAVLFNLLGYAVDKKHFPMNPLTSVSWKSPKVAEAIDRRRVVNPRQAQALLEAVAAQGPMGRHLEAFFGCIHHAGLRPSEAVMLTLDELELPDDESKWGWLHLGASAPSTGGAWNETGDRRERRHLKHRAATEVRTVPLSPAFARLLRKHIAEHGTAPDGRLFRGEGGGLLSDSICGRVWEKARQTALTPAEEASPPAERPYHLRHARLSTWLNAAVAHAQVAEWASNSVPVLLRVYAKCSPTPSKPLSAASSKPNQAQRRPPGTMSRLPRPVLAALAAGEHADQHVGFDAFCEPVPDRAQVQVVGLEVAEAVFALFSLVMGSLAGPKR